MTSKVRLLRGMVQCLEHLRYLWTFNKVIWCICGRHRLTNLFRLDAATFLAAPFRMQRLPHCCRAKGSKCTD